MVLAIHVASAVIGVVGACLSAAMVFVWPVHENSAKARKAYGFSRGLVLVGLLGSVASGVYLFANDWQTLIQSSRFLSNMTILGAIVVVELLIFRLQPRVKSAHITSAFSWMWIFVVALVDPPYSYGTIMAIYLLAVVLIGPFVSVLPRLAR